MSKINGPRTLILRDANGGKLEVVSTFKQGVAHTSHKPVAEAWQSVGAIVAQCEGDRYRIIYREEVDHDDGL